MEEKNLKINTFFRFDLDLADEVVRKPTLDEKLTDAFRNLEPDRPDLTSKKHTQTLT